MSYAQSQRNPTRHLVGIVLVLLLHILLVWALMNGLAREVVRFVRAPVETKIIEEVKPPPPEPPKIELPPPPKFVPPPPAYVPPPEVVVNVPPPPQTTITPSTIEPPPAPPPVVAPRVEAPPPVAAPAPPAPAPAPRSASILCPGYKEVIQDAGIPREAARAGIDKGEVELMLTIGTDGTVKKVEVTRSSNRLFNRGAVEAAKRITCNPQPAEVDAPLTLGYTGG